MEQKDRVEELGPDKFGAGDERRLSGEAGLSPRTLQTVGTLLPTPRGPIRLCTDCGRSPECKGERELGQDPKAEAGSVSWGHGQEFSFTPVAVRNWCWILGKKEQFSDLCFGKLPPVLRLDSGRARVERSL